MDKENISFLVPTWNPTEFGYFQADLAYVHEVCGDHLWCWSKEGPHTSHTSPDHKWQQICWWPKSGTGWCGCVFQISLGDAYLRRLHLHFDVKTMKVCLAHARNGTPLNKLMLPFTTYRCQHGYGHGVLNAGWWFETFSFLPHTWQRWSNLTFAYFSDGFKPPTRLEVSWNGGTPISHHKMIIFSRKTPWLLGTSILGNPHIDWCFFGCLFFLFFSPQASFHVGS